MYNFNNIMNNNTKNYNKNIYENTSSFMKTEINDITDEEYKVLFLIDTNEQIKDNIIKNIISNIFLNDSLSIKRAHSLFEYLVNREGGYSDSEINFITYYIVFLNYHRFKYDEKGNERIEYKEAKTPIIKMTSAEEIPNFEKTLAAYSSIGNMILVNKDLSIEPFRDGNKDELFSYIQILSHEMIHYRQSYEASHGILTPSSFNGIVSNIIRVQSFDDHKKNYRFRHEEVEAQIESMEYAIEVAKEFFPDYIDFQEKMLAEKEDYLLEEALSMQQDDTSALVLRDFYDIGGLSVTISQKPDYYLSRYPQLLVFFNNQGQIRNEKELLRDYVFAQEENNPIADVYEQFLVYIYHKDDILSNTDLPNNVLLAKKAFISLQVKKEEKYLSQIKQIIDDHKQKVRSKAVWEAHHVEDIVKLRKQRLQGYHEFLSSVGEKIDNTDDIIRELQDIINDYEDIIIEIDKTKQLDEILKDNVIEFDDKYNDNNNKY